MQSLYKSYIRAFDKYASAALLDSNIYTISNFAIITHLKAHQLLQRASLNKVSNLPELQTELFKTGKDYILKFSIKQKHVRMLPMYE